MQTQTIGKIGENLAANYLCAKGYKILQKNFRAKQYGEVDLLVAHPDGQTIDEGIAKNGFLLFKLVFNKRRNSSD